MIKINLLDSVTDRARGIVDVEKEVSRPRTQTALMAGVVGFLLLAACGFDYWSASRKLSKLQDELAEQQRIADQVKQVKAEKEQLEKKKAAVEARIEAISRLRAAQSGPVAVLEEIRDRVSGLPGLYLKSLDQKGNTLAIEGYSQEEESVTRFGRSLEFSSGLFTGMTIETQKVGGTDTAPASTTSAAAAPPVYINFKINCTYNPPGSQNAANAGVNPSATAAPGAAGPAGAQVAPATTKAAANAPAPTPTQASMPK